jgi:hypothetical protein
MPTVLKSTLLTEIIDRFYDDRLGAQTVLCYKDGVYVDTNAELSVHSNPDEFETEHLVITMPNQRFSNGRPELVIDSHQCNVGFRLKFSEFPSLELSDSFFAVNISDDPQRSDVFEASEQMLCTYPWGTISYSADETIISITQKEFIDLWIDVIHSSSEFFLEHVANARANNSASKEDEPLVFIELDDVMKRVNTLPTCYKTKTVGKGMFEYIQNDDPVRSLIPTLDLCTLTKCWTDNL